MSEPTRVSVVVNTYNREVSLSKTLESLRHQTYPNFEVIAVNGPSTDGTAGLLNRWSSSLRVASCPERVLGKSRNVGVNAASGEVVAFIDDDSVAEPDWLQGLVAAYENPTAGGAGGLVFDRTGTRLQYRYTLCSRLGVHALDARPPFEANQRSGADPFLYLQGTNCSFRRALLKQIGGFDEEFTCIYDEVDVCLRITDLGRSIQPLAAAAVHHKLSASHVRNDSGVPTDPFPGFRDRSYFAYKHGSGYAEAEKEKYLAGQVKALINIAQILRDRGEITVAERDEMIARARSGVEEGRARAATAGPVPVIGAPDPDNFKVFPTVRPEGERLRFAFLTGEYPPGYFGGIGRFTQDLATGIAGLGHEVHVIAPAQSGYSVEAEEGVWVHRMKVQQRRIPELETSALKPNWMHLSALYHELRNLHERRPIDFVSAPLWNCESLLPCLDNSFPTAVTLTTTFKTIAGLHRSWDAIPNVKARIVLERATAQCSKFRHAISKAILEDVDREFGLLPGAARLIPLGIRDRSTSFQRREGSEKRLLFVGRLERRKGVDTLLEALPRLLAEFAELKVQLVGQSTQNTEIGESYKDWFLREHGNRPEIAGRVEFLGQLDEADLYQAYADCDVFCAPSRFESLGLVLLEAMMMGKPVVATRVGGMQEIVDENGFLVEPENVRDLAEALAKILRDDTTRLAMGTRSRELFESYWSLDKAVERTISGYREFLGEFRSGEKPDLPINVALAELIKEIEGLTETDAVSAAGALLDRSSYPIDHPAWLRELWGSPDEEFVAALYDVLLQRGADVAGTELHIQKLRQGADRFEIVRSVAFSPEARRKDLDHSWLEGMSNELHRPGVVRLLNHGPKIMRKGAWAGRRTYEGLRNLANLDTLLEEGQIRLLQQIEQRMMADRIATQNDESLLLQITRQIKAIDGRLDSLLDRIEKMEKKLTDSS